MDLLATQFELNSTRNIFLSLSQYSTCLTAGCLPESNKWRENLMNLYARISLCRTVNRSLDYCACLSRVRKYGLGKHDATSPSITRLLTVASSLCDLIYYPTEFLAWLIEANVFGPNRSSKSFRLASISCWLGNIIISIIGNTLKLIQYRRLLSARSGRNVQNDEKPNVKDIRSEIRKCILTLINNFCFFLNCIHWFPRAGLLWSGKLPLFMVGLCGTVATLCNVIKMMI